MAAIHAAAFPAPEAWGSDAIGLQLGLPGTFGLISHAGGMILARIAGDEAEIVTLAVMPTGRRRGLGRALVTAAKEEAAAGGARAIFLEVSTANLPAQALYAGTGFVEVGRRPRYYLDGADALLMRARLTPHVAGANG